MNRLLHLLRTTIGRKLIVAATGIVLILFVIGHVSGNMTIYVGPSALNDYAHFLQTSPMLWVVRLAILAIVLLHIALGIAVTRENYLARPVTYHAANPWYLRLYQRRMIISGLVLLAFIAGHVAHLTLGIGVGDGIPFEGCRRQCGCLFACRVRFSERMDRLGLYRRDVTAGDAPEAHRARVVPEPGLFPRKLF